jgi:hypothetical protein
MTLGPTVDADITLSMKAHCMGQIGGYGYMSAGTACAHFSVTRSGKYSTSV